MSEPAHEPLVPPPAFRIDEEPAPPGVALLVLAGEVDLATSGRFREFVDRARARGARTIVADLAEVTFMDSTMLRELLRAHRDLEESGARLVLAAPQAAVMRLLDLTGTTSLFALAATRQEALAGLG